jgi:hypothetical protein
MPQASTTYVSRTCDNFAGTSAQVLAVLMLTCVVEARLIVRAVERKPAMVSTVGNFAIYMGAGIAWIVVVIYDLVALMWCLRSLAGSPEPGVDAGSVLRAIGVTAANGGDAAPGRRHRSPRTSRTPPVEVHGIRHGTATVNLAAGVDMQVGRVVVAVMVGGAATCLRALRRGWNPPADHG